MKSREERIEHIRRVLKSANDDNTLKNYYTIKHWRGKPLFKKIIQIDSEFIMFRIENSRTEIQQLAYIRKHGLSKDFFNDPESLLAQQAQEDILLEMIRSKGKDLLEDLRNRKQEDACIITYDGYLVNGNRRTAALKSLDERYIDCIVLPEDTTPKDIYYLEQQLQLSQDFREKYHWINELKNIRRGIEDRRFEFSEKELAANLRLDLKELRVRLRMLELIDSFLIWKNKSGEYDYPKLNDAEEIFLQLEKAIKKYSKDQFKREALQKAVFALIEERPATGRVYDYVMELFRSFDKVCEKFTTYRKPDIEPEIKTNDPNGEITLLDEILSDATIENNDVFGEHEEAQETSSKLVEAIADVKAENKEKRDSEATYEGVSAALRELQGLIIDSDTAKLGSIKSKLEQIISSAKRLQSDISSLEG
jgi:hypothetical protein